MQLLKNCFSLCASLCVRWNGFDHFYIANIFTLDVSAFFFFICLQKEEIKKMQKIEISFSSVALVVVVDVQEK